MHRRWFDVGKITRSVAVSAVLTLNPVAGRGAPPPALPFSVDQEAWSPLYDRVDSELQAGLEEALNRRPHWKELLSAKKMGVGIVDLSEPEAPRFARVNGRVMMYAASLPKIAVLVAAYAAIEDGTLEETPGLHEDLVSMIRKSSNPAATRVIDQIGLDRIEEVLRDPRYGLYDEDKGGGLWVGKRYAKSGERNGDPLKGVSHGATVTQVCRLYYLLANGRIINPQRSREILEILASPGLHHKFVGVIEQRAPEAKLFRKSGTWKNWHSDSILVWGPVWRRYILVALLEAEDGEEILRELVPVVEDLLRPEESASP